MTNIFVGNLPYTTTEDELHSAFGAYGQVDRVSIVRDRETGQPRGFAFVEMSNDAEAGPGSPAGPGEFTATVIVKVDPKTLIVREVLRRPNSQAFGAGTVAVEIGKEYWVGSYRGDRIAIFPAAN